ncbi:MAG: sialate O-acetylesterase [Trueperaceae bacterium]|nr:sialate O-acetylesterase [Trueperaceae bacterium]
MLPPAPTVTAVEVAALAPVAAAELVLERPANVVGVNVAPLRDEVLVRASVDGNLIRVAWLAASAASGLQLRLELVATGPVSSVPDVLHGAAFASASGADQGATVVSVRATDAAGAAPTAPLGASSRDLTSSPLTLLGSFAARPLGDVDEDGLLGVRDALLALERLAGGGWSDAEAYHADVTGDDLIDGGDLALLVERLVDLDLPARLQVKPTALSFAQLDPDHPDVGVVLIGNQGRRPFPALTWQPPTGVVASAAGGIPGQSQALALELPRAARKGWRPGRLTVSDGAGDLGSVRLGHLVVLVLGQSNASGRGQPVCCWPETSNPFVRMLGNDYVWKNASEPLDTNEPSQRDYISEDMLFKYSLGTRLGHLLWTHTGFPAYLIPGAKFASRVAEWWPGATGLEQNTLFGSANFRAQVSAGLATNPVVGQAVPSEGGPVSVIVWYQGESDGGTASLRDAYVGSTNTVMDAYDAELGVPIVYVQLASHYAAQNNLEQHVIAEWQRRMETGSGYGEEARPNFHMVVAFDLPRSDEIHLSAFGQRVLAERVELAVREHVLDEPVDGTGPRLVALRRAVLTPRVIDIETTRVLADHALTTSYFRVFDGDPGRIDDAGYGTNVLPIASVARHPSDPTSVRITLAATPAGIPFVRYMAPPALPYEPTAWETVAAGVVRAAEGGLPLPAFGPLAAVD